MQVKKNQSPFLRKLKGRKIWFSSFLLLFLLTATAAAFFSAQTNQDIRQQASGGIYGCKQENEMAPAGTTCCEGLVKASTPHGYVCTTQGECTEGETKCQKEGTLYFEYTCESTGYFEKTKRCDGGCDGNSCKADVCTPGETRCKNDQAEETCSSDGTGWSARSCTNGCSDGSCSSGTGGEAEGECKQENEMAPAGTTCCEGLVKASTPHGYVCTTQGECTEGETKCQKEGTTSFEYTCDSTGYFEKTKRCDGGCDGNSCRADVCTPGETRCKNDQAEETCSSDGTGWSARSCTNGCSDGSCSGGTGGATESECKQENEMAPAGTTCCEGLVKASTPHGYVCTTQGECTEGETKCQKEGTTSFEYTCDSTGYFEKTKRCDGGCDGNSCRADVCTPGSTHCVDGTKMSVCSSDGTGWTTRSCTNGCSAGSCVSLTAQADTCGANGGSCINTSQCSNVGRVPGEGSCSGSFICCTLETVDCTPGESQCTGDDTGKRCNSSGDTWIGFVCPNDGTCSGGTCSTYERSLKSVGEECNGNDECESGYCYADYETVPMVGTSPLRTAGASTARCHAEPLEDVNEEMMKGHKASMIVGGSAIVVAGGIVAVPAVGGALTTAGITAYSYGTAALTTAPAWVQMAAGATALTVGGAGVVKGTTECARNPNSDACTMYVASLMIDPLQVSQLASGADDFLTMSYQYIDDALTRQIDDTFSWSNSLGAGYNSVSVDDMDYISTMDDNVLGQQLMGQAPSPALDAAEAQYNHLVTQGMGHEEAVTVVSNNLLGSKYQHDPSLVIGDGLKSFEDMVDLNCQGIQCRHISQFSTALSNRVGLDADLGLFNLSQGGEYAGGHAVTLFKQADGSLGVIDATNDFFSQNAADIVEFIGGSGYSPGSNIEGAMKGYNYIFE